MADKAVILAVDDSEDVLNLIAATLGKEHEVRKASDGAGALHAAFEEPRPDLILLDVEMPDVTGFQICSTLKAAPAVADIPIIFLTGESNPRAVIEGFKLGAIDYLLKPVSPPVLAVRVRTHLDLIRHKAKQDEMLAERTVQLERTRLELIRRLGRAMEYHETSAVGNRVVRLGHYARALAKAAGARPAMCDLIMKAAPLHDIGKVGVPASVLRKSSALTAPEREQMQRHPEIGAEIIGEHDDALLKLARTLALTHHERWDGNGYPSGARGADIPWAGRLMAIVDSFESMTATQFHREPRPIDLAADEIFRGGGKQFDPQLVDAFREALPEFRRIHATYGDQLGDLLNLDFSTTGTLDKADLAAANAEADSTSEMRAMEGMRESDEDRAAALAGAQARLQVERELAAAAKSDIVTRKDAVKRAEERAAREATLLAAAKQRIAEENDAARAAREQEGAEKRAEETARQARVAELNVIAAAMEREKAADALAAAKDRRKVTEEELEQAKRERAQAEARAAQAEEKAQDAIRDMQRLKELQAHREAQEKALREAQEKGEAALRGAELAARAEAEAKAAQAATDQRLALEQAQEKRRAEERAAQAALEQAAEAARATQFQKKIEAEAREVQAAAEKRLAAEQERARAEAERLAAEDAAAAQAKAASDAEAKVAELAREAAAMAEKANAAAQAKAKSEEALAKAAADKLRAKEAVAYSGGRARDAELRTAKARASRERDDAAAAAITIAPPKRGPSPTFGLLLGLLLGLTAAGAGTLYLLHEMEPTVYVVRVPARTPAVQPADPKPLFAEGQPIALRFDDAWEKIPPR